ncbi:MAG: polysaccharide deacetylase family protein [Thermoanaerobaculia bacterium]|nr:polysaccharide deacetylase family protein [Thermoanaerobaculia bacterium]
MLPHVRIRNTVANGLEMTPVGRLCRWTASRLFGGFILAFHRSSGRALTEQVEALRPSRVIALDEMVSRLKSGRSTSGLLAITVDDGYAATVEEYCQIARERQWPMTFYLPTAYLERGSLPFLMIANLQRVCPPTEVRLGGRDFCLVSEKARTEFFAGLIQRMYTAREADYMPLVEGLASHLIDNGLVPESSVYDVEPPVAWADVERWAREPTVSFQSHGVSHQAVVSLQADELHDELVRSKEVIEEHTNNPVAHFCYPYGGPESIGQNAPKIVSEVFSSSVTMSRGRLRGSDPFLLPRVPLYEQDTGNVACLKVLTA